MQHGQVIVGQKVDREKLQCAKDLRKRMTVAERLLWAQLRSNRLKGLHFRRQQVIDGFIVDFYCHAAKLVVEVDGGIHMSSSSQDAERDRALSQRGLKVLRITNDEVMQDLAKTLVRIADCGVT